jgi:hypothetical protein
MVNISALFTNSQDSQVERCPMLHSPWIRKPAPTGIGVLVSSTIKQSHPGCRQVLNNNLCWAVFQIHDILLGQGCGSAFISYNPDTVPKIEDKKLQPP